MQSFEGMYEAVKFIEKNLKEEITVKDVADDTGYSLYHFSRCFNETIGHSPYDYIMRRRLSEAAKDLIESEKKIIDIALDYGFNNPETFSRAFKKMFNMLPKAARQKKIHHNLLFKSEITLDYLKHINRGRYLEPQFLEPGPINLVGMAVITGSDSMTKANLWNRLRGEIESITERKLPERYYSISFHTEDLDSNSCFYMAGIEVNTLEKMPHQLIGKAVPPLKYAKFIHKGPIKKINMTLDYIYQTWLPKSGNRTAAPFEIEYLGTSLDNIDDPDFESEILIPVEQIA